ncbi:hypothetical protein H0H92_009447 [Tricholoma furcatifolium]|nr:hypothetical protein H0H92_009447 [Tricholoma furcatifolium]
MSNTVYLEDIEATATKRVDVVTTNDNEPRPSPQTPTSSQSAKNQGSGAVKRQMTLMDMFSGSQSKEPSAKKMKLGPSGASSSSLKSSGSKVFGVPKLNSIPFSLSEYQEALTDDQKSLLKLECEVMGKSWLKLLKDEIKKPYFIALKKFLWDEGILTMALVKLMIYIELKEEYPEFEVPNHGNLSAWAANGVLMLNTCLTVRAREAGSHSNKGWEEFTDKVVDVVDKYGGANLPAVSGNVGVGRGVVFLAWGAWAAKRVAKLDKGKHLILKSAHPSPKSVDRGFKGNNHFKLANEWLEAKYGVEGKVDWCNLSTEP